ncbi:MAG: metallophosphoesterase [Acidobacteriia bacterium]|nr:metallophosphoesterase [Terriglobia bacterium]
MAPTQNLKGPKGQLYAEQKQFPDETQFQRSNTSSAYYNSPYYLVHKNQVQPIPARRNGVPPNIQLADYVPAEVGSGIQAAKSISFHSVGDTGAAKVSRTQTAATALEHQAAVADAMVADVQKGGPGGPAFFFHLGDIIYNFGEGQYYYDQFYEPYREYDRPIFAIPGNHDGMVFGQGSTAPQGPTLDAFLTNFCAASPGPSPDGGGLVRSVMTQPGVYFTLDAPYVSIIGLYSNVLDGPGVISSQGGHFPLVNDQLDFLASELQRLKADRQAGKRAIILAIHHLPLSTDTKHGGSTGPMADIDAVCKKAGLWPDAVLSGHAHLYQRFTRVHPNGSQAPYIVCGSGGFSATPPSVKPPAAPFKLGDFTLEVNPIVEFGYLTVTTDAKTLTITFFTAMPKVAVAQADTVTVDLKKGAIVGSGGSPVMGGSGGKSPSGTKKPRKKGKG